MRVSYLEPARRAWTRMRGILFEPFDVVKWLVIGLCAWLAGLLDGSGGGGPHLNVHSHHPSASADEILQSARGAWERVSGATQAMLADRPWIVVFILVVPLLIAAVLFFVWLTSRFKLIYLDNVVRNRGEVVEPWRRLGRLGDSLFLWRVGFGLVSAVVVGLCVALFFGFGVLASWPAKIILVFIGGIMLFACIVALIFTWLFLESFVVPIMYRLDLSAMDAWRHFLSLFALHGGEFVLYGLFVLVLFLGVGLAIAVVGLLTCCVGFILLALPYIGVLLLLPLHVAYRLLGPEFLAQFDPGLALAAPLPAGAPQGR